MKSRGFTLIELVAVIGIILGLAGLLFPVFLSAKVAAKTTVCISNLGQIGKSMALYSLDFDDRFPAAKDALDEANPDQFGAQKALVLSFPRLTDALQPYSHSRDIFRCPLDDGAEFLPYYGTNIAAPSSAFAKYQSSYSYLTVLGLEQVSWTDVSGIGVIPIVHDLSGFWHQRSGPVPIYYTLYSDLHIKRVSEATLSDGLKVTQ